MHYISKLWSCDDDMIGTLCFSVVFGLVSCHIVVKGLMENTVLFFCWSCLVSVEIALDNIPIEDYTL